MPTIPFYANFFFYYEGLLNFAKFFTNVHRDGHVIFVLFSVDMMYYIKWFLDIKPTLHSWGK